MSADLTRPPLAQICTALARATIAAEQTKGAVRDRITFLSHHMHPALRLGFRTLSVLAPGIAARIGARLWFAIPRPRINEEAMRFLDTGTRFDVDVDGTRVAAWRWGEGPIVLLMHGWGGYGAQLRSFVEPLVRAGHRVIIYDAPSHGASDAGRLGPRHATLFDFADTAIAISRDAGDIAGVIAHSGGCAAAAWGLTKSASWRPRRMVFIAPFGRPARYMHLFQRELGLTDRAMRRFRQMTEHQFNFRWADLEVPEIAARVQTPPLLVIHDKDDRETSWKDGAEIAAAWPGATLEFTTGLGHNRILRDPAVVASAVRFAATH